MTGSLSLLQRATPADVKTSPYPLLVLDGALPVELYTALEKSFPSTLAMGVYDKKNNHRWNYSNSKARRNWLIPQIWKQFLAYHSSQQFYDEIIALFEGPIKKAYPGRFENGELGKMRAGARNVDPEGSRDVFLDAMISGNSPVTVANSVRTTHVDAGDKLFSGLLYMRPDGYDAIGGDLTISRFRPEYTADKMANFRGQYVYDEDRVEVIETVPYAKNRLVLFINTLDSLHGVTVRQPTRHQRLFVNLVGEVDPPLYGLFGKN
ncbi:hypothetical protein [Devosia sp.]|uniref:hypothetical protein n=1 Tax=Devosia sp. TaxID=1871048 RepID=UPI003BACD9FB